MSLPPLSPSNKFILPIYIKPNQAKFKTSSNIKILNPLIPIILKEKDKNLNLSINKAFEVMSPIPPSNIYNSKFGISRLSPIIKENKQSYIKKTSAKIKKQYFQFLENERYSEMSVEFSKPIRDYFAESLQNTIKEKKKKKNDAEKYPKAEQKNDKFLREKFILRENDFKGKTFEKEIKEEDNGPNKRHSTLAMPNPDLNTKKQAKSRLKKSSMDKEKDEINSFARYLNQSLQTDVNSFEFDEWEFDYDA